MLGGMWEGYTLASVRNWEVTLFSVCSIATGVAALFHLLLKHRDYRSAAFWATLVVLAPFTGAVFYAVLGINFVRRRGLKYRGGAGPSYRQEPLDSPLPFGPGHTHRQQDYALAVTMDRLSRFNFLGGNRVQVLRNGDEAMPQMLEAICCAQHSVTMASYIFEATGIGEEFVVALAAAVKRGVQVRVMVDDAGTRYSWPPITSALKRAGVPVKRFMPNRFILRILTMNLRNHRKLLVVDGKIGFTGGLNIREGTMLARNPSHPVQDLHFRVTGPAVKQMQRVFVEDWVFCAGEILEGEAWFPEIADEGTSSVLGIVDGPDEDLEIMPTTFFAALTAAREEVKIVTPYFLPTAVLMAALKLCATRGVKVSIITPAVNNIAAVAWAAQTLYPELIQAGCGVYESPGPFDHSKLLLIDGVWSCFGSTNWDPRSLRLNFEFNLIAHDPALALELNVVFDEKLAECTKVTLASLEALSLGKKLRNGFARLFIPFL